MSRPKCGKELPNDARFCPSCGATTSSTVSPPGAEQAKLGETFGNIGAVLGVIGLLIFPILFGPLAIVFGVMAMGRGNKNGKWGLALGIVDLCFFLLFLVIGLSFL